MGWPLVRGWRCKAARGVPRSLAASAWLSPLRSSDRFPVRRSRLLRGRAASLRLVALARCNDVSRHAVAPRPSERRHLDDAIEPEQIGSEQVEGARPVLLVPVAFHSVEEGRLPEPHLGAL